MSFGGRSTGATGEGDRRPPVVQSPDGGRRKHGITLNRVTLIIAGGRLKRMALPLAYVGGFAFIALTGRFLQGKLRCPGCGNWIAFDAERCPVCGRAIASDGELWNDPKAAMSPLNEVAADVRFHLIGLAVIIGAATLILDPSYWPVLPAALATGIVFSMFRVRTLSRGIADEW